MRRAAARLLAAARAGAPAAVAMILAASTPARGQDWGLSGMVDLGYRSVSASGNEDKYREDVNLPEGVRLFQLELLSRPESSGFMDEFLLTASGLGGDPYTRAGLRLRKAGRYDLQAGYRGVDFFYRDAGYFFSDIGDLHTWDARRKLYDLSLAIHAADWITVRLGAERMERSGRSRTSAGLQQEVFLLAQPVDQESTSAWLGLDFHWDWADLTVEQRLDSYESRWQQTSGASDGLEPGGSALDTYSLLEVQEADTPVSRFQLAGAPHEAFRFTLGYAHMSTDADYGVEGDWQGVDFTSAAFQTMLTNTGAVSRDTDMADLDLTWSPVRQLDLAVDIKYRTYDQDGSIDFLEIQSGGDEAGNYPVQGSVANTLELLTYGLTADWRVSSAWSLLAGVGIQTRDTDFDLTGPAVETERTIYRAGVGFRPGRTVDLRLDLETGEDDSPLTQVSPTDIERLMFRGRIRPTESLLISFHYRDETRENLLTYPLGVPTDDVPPATGQSTAGFQVASWGGQVGWTPRRLDLSLGYTRTEIDSNADINYITGFTFTPAFDIFTTLSQTGYISDQDSIQAVVRVELGRNWTIGALAALTRNEGTFPLDWSHASADVGYRLPRGVSVRAAWHRYELDETNPYAGPPATPQPSINDYDADLWTLAVGYTF